MKSAGLIRFASNASQALLERNHCGDIDSVFAKRPSSQVRHTGRAVAAIDLREADGRSERAYVKLNWGRRRVWPRMTDLKSGQVFQTLPEREWNGIKAFADLGLNVPERLALFQEGLLNVRAAVIVRAVPPPHSLDEMLAGSGWKKLSGEQRDALLQAVVDVMRQIHAGNLGWRGTGSRHFFPKLDEQGRWKLWLIDCEGVHTRATPKVIERDFRKLMRAMKESGADAKTLENLQMKIGARSSSCVADAA